ncbi:MAG: hypothetical protein ACYC8T_05040 [Myxococcaceae bacterium]
MRPFRLLALCAPLVGCAGPAAPDAALCQDVIHRLCLEPRCEAVETTFAAGANCEQTLLDASGCGAEDFAFSTPSRARVLECRLPLLRNGAAPGQPPACDDVDETLELCDDLVRLLKGGAS